MNEIAFINYRRNDAGAEANLIAKALSIATDNKAVFLDISSIESGATWPDRIRSALENSQYVLVVIGPDWLRAGSDEWGQRRIDQEVDWVRQEIAVALRDNTKTIIPVLVRGGQVPPSDVLPEDISNISSKQAIELRQDYWDHDIKLLTAQIGISETDFRKPKKSSSIYPRNVPIGPQSIDDETIDSILTSELTSWSKIASALPENQTKVRVELFREYQFQSFQQAIHFMTQVAPGCDIANHHPRWENIWKTIRVYLTTWDIGHQISDRDIQLARYFDRAYSEYPGAIKQKTV